MVEIFAAFEFSASHWLPYTRDGHPCAKMHGHNFKVRVWIRGPLTKPEGWVEDFAIIRDAWDKHVGPLVDHQCLNDAMGNPTSENIATFIRDKLKPHLPSLCRIEVQERDGSGVRLEENPES